MAAKIKEAVPGAEIELIGGSAGVFTVIADGKELWNKHEEGSFPNENQLAASIGALS